jgi:hypothetical protein
MRGWRAPRPAPVVHPGLSQGAERAGGVDGVHRRALARELSALGVGPAVRMVDHRAVVGLLWVGMPRELPRPRVRRVAAGVDVRHGAELLALRRPRAVVRGVEARRVAMALLCACTRTPPHLTHQADRLPRPTRAAAPVVPQRGWMAGLPSLALTTSRCAAYRAVPWEPTVLEVPPPPSPPRREELRCPLLRADG